MPPGRRQGTRRPQRQARARSLARRKHDPTDRRGCSRRRAPCFQPRSRRCAELEWVPRRRHAGGEVRQVRCRCRGLHAAARRACGAARLRQERPRAVHARVHVRIELRVSDRAHAEPDALGERQQSAHRSGDHDAAERAHDPEFQMRDVELQLHHQPLTKAQFARYLYGLPLVSAPGVTYHYSNSGYTLLGMIVTKATHRQLMSYIDSAVLAPLGITNVEMTRTNPALRDPREIVPDEQPNNSGPSIFDLSSNPATRRFSDGGGGVLFEVSDAPTSMSTTADSLVRFLHSYAAWGSGGRSPGAARDGCMAGVATWIESRKDGVDWAFLTNKDDDLKLCFDFTTDGVKQLDQLFDNNSV